MKDNHIFPWGIYIGELTNSKNTLPLCLDSKMGGFCLIYEKGSEKVLTTFIESITLKLFSMLSIGTLKVNIFDFGKNRFKYLSALGKANLYEVAFSQNKANILFEKLEDLALVRHHLLLSFETPSLVEYNQANSATESFHLLIINLDDFPEEMRLKRIKSFFDSAYEAGFYTIAFGTKEVLETDSKATKIVLKQFPHINLKNKIFHLSKEVFEFKKILKEFKFKPIDENRTFLVNNMLNKYELNLEKDSEQDWLSIPIGKVGRESLYFNMGLKSEIHHAFIAGMTGTGKTTLLNKLIVEIAKNYTAKEIELYLMDYKPAGAEFVIFKNHPNCKKLFLDKNNPQLAFNILKEFQEDMYERGTKLNGKNIDEYNKKNPSSLMPRKILIIDEIQRMFSGDFKSQNEFNELIEDIIKAGRSFGLHLILTTQSLRQIKMKDSIMGQIPLKLSFRLSDTMEGMRIFSENKEANNKVPKLKKYNFIYVNPQKTVVAKADYIDKDEIVKTLQTIKLSRKSDEILIPMTIETSKKQPKKSTPQKQTREEGSYKPIHNTSSAKDLLAKVKKESEDE